MGEEDEEEEKEEKLPQVVGQGPVFTRKGQRGRWCRCKDRKEREKTISREKTILDQLEKSDQNHTKLNQQEPDEIL